MKKILIIATDFLPYSSSFGACSRIFKLALFLRNEGVSVHIISGKGINQNYYGFKDQLEGIHLHYLQDPFKSSKDSINKLNRQGAFVQKIVDNIKQYTKKLLIPDIRVLLVSKISKYAIQLITKEQIDNVLISTPPHSIQKVGIRLKNHFGDKINLFVDYRDSWNTRDLFKRNFWLLDQISKSIEKEVINTCDVFTYASEPMVRNISKLLKLNLKNKSHLVMNGFDNAICKESKLRANLKSKIQIGYFGLLINSKQSYGYIDPLIEVVKNNPIFRKELCFNLFGEIVLELQSDDENFIIFPSLDYCDALTKMKQMDVLMIYYSKLDNCEEVITGKFFDYVKTEKPIIVFSSPEMEAFKLVERYNLGFTVDISDSISTVDGLNNLIHDIKSYVYKPSIDINYFNSSAQFSKILELLN